MATEPAPTGGSPRGRVRVGAILLVVGLAVAVLLIDQLTKLLALANLQEGVSVPVLGPVAGFMLERNSGAAYSMGAGYTWIFAILAAAVAVFLIIYTRRIRSLGWAAVFGLLLGGTLGNLGDRLFREPSFGMGHVVDFISIPWLGFVCNGADVAITAAMVVFIVLILRGVGLDGVRRSTTTKSEAAEAGEASEPAATEPRDGDA